MPVSVSIGKLSALTDKHFVPMVSDNVFLENPFLVKLRKNIDPVDGGEDIRIPLRHSKNALTGRWGGGDDTLPTNGNDANTQAVFPWRYYQSTISLPRTDILKNMGKARIVDMIKEEAENAAETLADELDVDCFLTGEPTTGKPKLGLQGLAAMITHGSDPYTGGYGSVTRSGASGSKNNPVGNAFWNAVVFAANGNTTYTFWKSPVTMDNSAVITLGKMQALYGAVGRPDLIMCSQTIYDKYWSLLTNIQRQLSDDELGKIGFQNIVHNGAAIVVADNIDSASTVYALTMKHIKFKVHKEMNFTPTDFIKPPNQEVLIKRIHVMGNLVCNRPNRQGKMTGTTAA